MPVSVKKRGELYRVVETATGRIAKTENEKAVDGGGHASREKALRQVRAINMNRPRTRRGA